MSLTAAGWLLGFMVGVVLAFMRHPIFGLYTYLLVYYNDPYGSWWGGGLPPLRWSLIAAVVMLSATIIRKPRSKFPSWHANWAARCLILYVGWMWIQTLWAVDPGEHFEGCVLFTKYIALFFVIYRLASTEAGFTMVSFGHVLGCFILGWSAFTLTVHGRMESVVVRNADDSNLIAAHMVTGLVIGGFLWLWVKTKVRWISFLSLPFVLNAIVLTASRSGFISMGAASIGTWVWSPRGTRIKIGLILALGGVLLLRLSNDLFLLRISTIWSGQPNQESDDREGRLKLIRFGLDMVRDYPFGAGSRGYRALSPKYMSAGHLSGGGGSPHATWVAVLVDQGYPGFVIFLVLHVWVGFRLLRLLTFYNRGLPPSLGLKRAAVAGSLMVCIASGQLVNLLNAEVEIWLLALFAAIDSLCREAVLGES